MLPPGLPCKENPAGVPASVQEPKLLLAQPQHLHHQPGAAADGPGIQRDKAGSQHPGDVLFRTKGLTVPREQH